MYNGQKLKELIEKKRLTYEEIAKKSGLSKTTIYLIVNEKQEIKISNLEKIAGVLKVPISYFFSEIDDEVEKLQSLIALLYEKITLLEIQLSQFQKEIDINHMRQKSLSEALYQYDPSILNTEEVRDNITKYNDGNNDEEDPKNKLKQMIAELSLKIAKQRLLTLKTKLQYIE